MSNRVAAFACSLGFLASGLLSPAILAATPAASFAVTATVQAGCLISATSIPLKNHLATVDMAKHGVSVTCTMAIPYVVDLRTGKRLAVTAPMDRLIDPVSARSVVAGDPSLLNFDPILSGSSFQTLMDRRRISSVQSVAAGASAHVITVVVTY